MIGDTRILRLFESILDRHQQILRSRTSADSGHELVEFSLGSQRFSCRTPLAGYRRSILNALVNHGASVQQSPTADCHIAIAIAGEDGWPDLPDWAEQCMRDPGLHLAMEATPYRYLQQPPGCWQFFDQRSRCGVQLLRSATSLPPWDGGAPLRNFLHWHLISNVCGLLHAGTLGHAGQGILLAGPGGSGKSGTVLAGLLHGLQSVGDDYVLVRLDQDVTAYPLFQTLKQDPGGCERLGIPADSALRRTLNWQGKHQFTLADLGGDQPVDVRVGPGIDGGFAFAGVAAEADIIAVGHRDGTELPGIITPHPGHEHRLQAATDGQHQPRAGAGIIKPQHRFGYPDRGFARRCRSLCPDQQQAPPRRGGIDRLGSEQHGGAIGGQPQRHLPHKGDTGDPGCRR